ncbi:MAG: SDR family oxidoreductase [Planctomycetota bacterium]
MNLTDKTALVTGGAKRIGAAIARSLSDAGVRVAIHCHESLEEAKELQHSCPGSVVIEADLADRDARDAVVPEAIRALGGLDILVNNAAIWESAPLPEIDQQHWDRMLEINLTAPFFLAREAGRRMKEAGSGLIVNLTDWAVERPYPGKIAYFAAKGGLEAVSRGLARALAPEVRVVSIAPGAAVIENGDAAREATLLKRLGGAESIAETVLFAARNDFLTGTTLTVDGGRNLA